MFQGLSTALTSLYASQQALDTIGNNIANANTEGYSREEVVLSPKGGQTIPSFWSTPPKVGTGVNVDDIVRMRDAFLDARSLQEHSTSGQMSRSAASYSSLEQVFAEPSDTGIQEQLSKFWASWDDVANNPGDLAARSQVIQQGQTVASALNQASTSLKSVSSNALQTMKNDVIQLNAWAANVGSLNTAIQSAEQAGTSPNALLDQRDLLINKMSDLADVTVTGTENGSVQVSIGGVALVRDACVNNLQVDDTGTTPYVRWDQDNNQNTVTDGAKAVIKGGDIAGQLDTINNIVPKYQTLLDSVASNLTSAVNGQHASGTDKNGNVGGAFFVGTTASTITVDSALASDPTLLAAASAGGGALDGENARTMATLANSSSGADAVYRQMVDTLGVESQTATSHNSIQQSIVTSVDNAKASASGVNLDEEMANMIRFQKSYNASAKYLSVMDGVMDSVINLVR